METPGVERLLTKLYDAHGARLYRYALVLVGSQRDAEDVVQDVFVRLAAHDDLGLIRDSQAYLFAAIRNEAATCLRRRQRRARHETDMDEADYLIRTTEPAPVDYRKRCIAEALRRLPSNQRVAIALHAFEGLTFAEAGALLGESPHTMASRYRLGVARLTDWLHTE